jgi:hypothetical protein
VCTQNHVGLPAYDRHRDTVDPSDLFGWVPTHHSKPNFFVALVFYHCHFYWPLACKANSC